MAAAREPSDGDAGGGRPNFYRPYVQEQHSTCWACTAFQSSESRAYLCFRRDAMVADTSALKSVLCGLSLACGSTIGGVDVFARKRCTQ